MTVYPEVKFTIDVPGYTGVSVSADGEIRVTQVMTFTCEDFGVIQTYAKSHCTAFKRYMENALNDVRVYHDNFNRLLPWLDNA
jgi:hypothetical protein